ncbi:MAG: VWA domain-containing protein [Alistipes sp.]|nr:VWA domain-containing protein [Alistipes sp.]
MFRFAHPHILWLLLSLPLLLLLFEGAALSRRRRLARFGNPATLAGLMPDRSTARVRLKSWLLLLALACVILAAARPQFGSKLREERAEGIEMMLVVDVSNSMLAEDFEPTRLERTKYAIGRLFEGMHQDRVGLVVFAGEAKVQLPITSDYRMARAFTKRISPSLVDRQGTDLAQALSLATISFSSGSGEKKSRAIILITDGEGHEGDLEQAAQRAKAEGIRIYTIGIGTPEGAPIRLNGEFLKDEKGDMVVTKLDEKSLQMLATTTDGLYVRASKQDLGLEEVIREINAMEKSEMETLRFEEYNEQYPWLLTIGLVLLLLEFALLDRRNPLLKSLNIFRR